MSEILRFENINDNVIDNSVDSIDNSFDNYFNVPINNPNRIYRADNDSEHNSEDLNSYKSYNEEKDCRSLYSLQLNEKLNENNSEIVLALTKCFICLSSAINPLSCPKCNNFACKKCFTKYFEESSFQNCPLCKERIYYTDLKKNIIINNIEEILAKCEGSAKKLRDLSYIMNKKRLELIKEENDDNDIIYKILDCLKRINMYRKEYDLFLSQCKEIFNKIFDEYENKIKEIYNSLFPVCKNSDQLNKNNIDKNLNQEKIKSVINEIISMERMEFNKNNKNRKIYKNEIKKYFFSSKNMKFVENFIPKVISIISNLPIISNYNIGLIKIERSNLKHSKIKKKGYNAYLGDFVIQYILYKNDKYCCFSDFSFSSKNKDKTNFFISQKKIVNNKYEEIIPMQLNNEEEEKFHYKLEINLEEFKNKNIKEIIMEINVQIFSTINK